MWDLAKINRFIQEGIEENTHLDYKGADSLSKQNDKKKELSKDVSAFANSDGGVIIYGVRESNGEMSHLPEKIDPIDGKTYSKEWLEDVINSTISPRIQNIKITPIQTSESRENQVIYVVEIPKSSTAHQMNDKRYYRRYNFQSIPMEDWEIKDIINRRNTSDVEIRFEKMDVTPIDTIKRLIQSKYKNHVNYAIIAHNKGGRVAQMVNVFISGNKELSEGIKRAEVDSTNSFELHFSNEIERKIIIDGQENILSLERIPVMPLTYRTLGVISISPTIMINDNVLIVQISTEDYSRTNQFLLIDLLK